MGLVSLISNKLCDDTKAVGAETTLLSNKDLNNEV